MTFVQPNDFFVVIARVFAENVVPVSLLALAQLSLRLFSRNFLMYISPTFAEKWLHRELNYVCRAIERTHQRWEQAPNNTKAAQRYKENIRRLEERKVWLSQRIELERSRQRKQ